MELHFDHAFSEDDEEDGAEQQQEDDRGTAGTPAANPAAAAEAESSDAPSGKLGGRVEASSVSGSSPGSSHILGSSPNLAQLTAASQVWLCMYELLRVSTEQNFANNLLQMSSAECLPAV